MMTKQIFNWSSTEQVLFATKLNKKPTTVYSVIMLQQNTDVLSYEIIKEPVTNQTSKLQSISSSLPGIYLNHSILNSGK